MPVVLREMCGVELLVVEEADSAEVLKIVEKVKKDCPRLMELLK